MGEVILVFLAKCFWTLIWIMSIIGPFVLLFWFIAAIIQFCRQTWKTGKDNTNYRFPPW